VSKRETENSRARSNGPENLSQAVAALRRGDVVVFPTETLYGLGADALDDDAVDRVFRLKGRNADNPIPVLVADEEMLRRLVAEIAPLAQRLMRRFWPGPLTLVLPAQKAIPKPLLNRDRGVGVRVSSHPIATELIRRLGRPLTATSANPSGKEPARTVDEAKRYFSGQIEIFVEGGPLMSKRGSTVVAVFDDALKILREGEISGSELRQVVGS